MIIHFSLQKSCAGLGWSKSRWQSPPLWRPWEFLTTWNIIKYGPEIRKLPTALCLNASQRGSFFPNNLDHLQRLDSLHKWWYISYALHSGNHESSGRNELLLGLFFLFPRCGTLNDPLQKIWHECTWFPYWTNGIPSQSSYIRGSPLLQHFSWLLAHLCWFNPTWLLVWIPFSLFEDVNIHFLVDQCFMFAISNDFSRLNYVRIIFFWAGSIPNICWFESQLFWPKTRPFCFA